LNPDLGEYKDLPKDSPQYLNALKIAQELYLENLYKVTTSLQKFIRFKNRIEGERDLQKLTPNELYDKVKDFSLEKTKATKQEKEEGKKTYDYPGSEVIFRGKDWTVVKISDKGDLGRNAACFFGGWHMESSKGETNWCTSSPGLRWFDNYIKDGDLFVVLPTNWSGKVGEKSGLPAERYQFHFERNQFMDVNDYQIDLIKFLNTKGEEIKPLFKEYFAKGLTVGQGKKFEVDDFERGGVGKFISLYGLDELIDSLPDSLTYFAMKNTSRQEVNIDLPPSISRFKNLTSIIIYNCVRSVPESICDLKNLNFITFQDCKNLESIPNCIGNLPKLNMINLMGSDKCEVPESVTQNARELKERLWDFNFD
jgi:hypothetical protein